MFPKITQIKPIIDSYKVELIKNDIKPLKFIVYGSFASGETNRWSDIDLVVVANDFGKRSKLERMEFLSQRAASINDSLEVLGYTSKEMKEEEDSIFGEVISNGIEVKV
ncbi:MAG: Nucleotidyltransferase [Berkelbacteria bacterium GW2011_GWA2_35_9]|uniref:Nucleotidyltransferase n=1 Tax=Berkelbacteria bacterium GW2011_GWA2_35_9 TaxID=1618333 RepID=A0A0G0D1B2_9BACT|nr:MAG: Nucleotidyltransferase [Berkelbacteria bacterium GW2011_GWA2_35_9]